LCKHALKLAHVYNISFIILESIITHKLMSHDAIVIIIIKWIIICFTEDNEKKILYELQLIND